MKKSAYFGTFLASAAATAKLARELLTYAYDAEYVLEQIETQTRDRPLFHGTWTLVTPSGRFPPMVNNECGLRVASVLLLMNGGTTSR